MRVEMPFKKYIDEHSELYKLAGKAFDVEIFVTPFMPDNEVWLVGKDSKLVITNIGKGGESEGEAG